MTGLKLEKEEDKAVLSAMQSISCEVLGWINHKLESRLPEEISTISDMQMIKSLLMRVKDESEKIGLKLNMLTKIMASSPNILLQIDGEKVEAVTDFIFLGSKITAAMKLKDACSLEEKLWQA